MGWITALTSGAIRKLVEKGALQLSLLDEQNLAEIASPDYPGERLVVCHNPLLEEERARKRQALLEATEKSLTKIAKDVARRKKKLLTAAEIGLKVGKVLGRYKVGKHFDLSASARAVSLGVAARRPSSRKPSWTGFTCCAPANPSSASRPKTPCAVTKAWRKWSARFAV